LNDELKILSLLQFFPEVAQNSLRIPDISMFREISEYSRFSRFVATLYNVLTSFLSGATDMRSSVCKIPGNIDVTGKAYITTVIRLRYDYDEKLTCSFFARVEWKQARTIRRYSRIGDESQL